MLNVLFYLDYLVPKSRFFEYLYSRLARPSRVKTVLFDHGQGRWGMTFRMQCVFNKVTRETRELKDVCVFVCARHLTHFIQLNFAHWGFLRLAAISNFYILCSLFIQFLLCFSDFPNYPSPDFCLSPSQILKRNQLYFQKLEGRRRKNCLISLGKLILFEKYWGCQRQV